MTQRAQTVITTMSHHAVARSTPGDAGDGLNPDWAALESGELMAWIALRRVNEGGVALLDGAFYHHGRAVPCYLNAPLTELVETDRLRLVDADPDTAEMRQVMFTENGHEWYEVLCGKRGVSSDSPINAFLGAAGQVRRGRSGPSAP